MTVIFALLAVLVTILFISAPLWRRDAVPGLIQVDARPDSTLSPVQTPALRRRALLEQRDTLLRELKELEFDRRMDKIDADDYNTLRAATAAQASDVIAQLALTPRAGVRRSDTESGRGVGGLGTIAAEAEILIARTRRVTARKKLDWSAEAEILVARARRKARPPLRNGATTWQCASCGRQMGDGDQFCASCGTARP